MIALWIFLYLLVAAVVVFLAIQLSKYVDLLDKKTKMSGAIIGGVFLAAVTSIPELFTSISALFILPGDKSSAMVIGNVLGSDLFNSAVLGLTFILFYKHMKAAKVGKGHISTVITLIIMYGLIAYSTLAPKSWQLEIGGAVNVISILLLVVYAISIKFMAAPEEEKEEEQDSSPLTVKQIVVRFIICAVLLIGASIGITYITDIIATELNLGKTFAGALFLGVATSLPEVSATISLCKLGNFNAAVGNIIGSNTFNCIILVLADICSWKNPVYVKDISSILLISLGALSAMVVCAAICHKALKTQKAEDKKGQTMATVLYTSCGAIMVLSYVAFLILSNVL